MEYNSPEKLKLDCSRTNTGARRANDCRAASERIMDIKEINHYFENK